MRETLTTSRVLTSAHPRSLTHRHTHAVLCADVQNVQVNRHPEESSPPVSSSLDGSAPREIYSLHFLFDALVFPRTRPPGWKHGPLFPVVWKGLQRWPNLWPFLWAARKACPGQGANFSACLTTLRGSLERTSINRDLIRCLEISTGFRFSFFSATFFI